jgi:hypothetical protein
VPTILMRNCCLYYFSQVYGRFGTYGLTCHVEKCFFGQWKLEYLVHIIATDRNKIKTVLVIFRVCGWFRVHVPNLIETSLPLSSLFQSGDDGTKRIASYTSVMFSPTELHHQSNEQEYLAVVWTIRKYWLLLENRTLTLSSLSSTDSRKEEEETTENRQCCCRASASLLSTCSKGPTNCPIRLRKTNRQGMRGRCLLEGDLSLLALETDLGRAERSAFN